MVKKILFIFFCFFSVTILQAQQHKSIHQLEKELHSNFNLAKYSQNTKTEVTDSIVPLNKDIKKNLSHAVFGYLPYWEYSKSMLSNIRFDLLTHIAIFDFAANSNGSIDYPPEAADWHWSNLINQAHDTGTKVVMAVTNFTGSEIHTIMTSSFPRWIFMNAVKSKILEYKLDGVNIDFEGIDQSDRGSLLNEFMQELADTVHNISSDMEVSFAAPAVDWGGWDLTNLAKTCDYLFVMGYDFFGSWSSTTGPTAPLVGGTYNVTNTINIEYSTVKSFYPNKLILGVPYYGPHWTTYTDKAGSGIDKFVSSEFFRNVQPLTDLYGLKWSSTYKNSWLTYKVGSTIHQIWFDTDSSLSLKYDLAISKKLKGVGMWALGYDGTRTELWDLLEKKFLTDVTEVSNENIPTQFELEQNYPNPFNPTTKIRFSIPENTSTNLYSDKNTTLKIYDVLGREIAILVNQNKQPGNYEVTWDASDQPSGVYFCTLSFGNKVQTRKMLLLK